MSRIYTGERKIMRKKAARCMSEPQMYFFTSSKFCFVQNTNFENVKIIITNSRERKAFSNFDCHEYREKPV